MGPAVGVEYRCGRVGAEPDGPGLVRAAGHRDVGLHVREPVSQVAGVHAERAQQLSQGGPSVSDREETWMETHTDQVIILGSLILGFWLIANSLYLIVT